MTNQGAKTVTGRASTGRASAKREAGSSRSLGTTHDGVIILKLKTKPTHFTTREIRSTIAQVLRESASGQAPGVKPGRTSEKSAETANR